ncbi:hypothetical protein [Streptomyces incarnatus]|uniref:hypothetical protein n=1 Tax=Streptomyces incarnatus TaxID=665007 RepID=UPI003CC57168
MGLIDAGSVSRVASSWSEEHSFPQECEAGSAEHLAFEHLDAVDVPFHDAQAPGQREPGDDRGPVTIDASGEGMKTGQVVLADCVEPLGQPLALSLGEDLGEGRTCPAGASGTET